MLDKIK